LAALAVFSELGADAFSYEATAERRNDIFKEVVKDVKGGTFWKAYVLPYSKKVRNTLSFSRILVH
jgi:hypothetical protein